MLVDQVIRDEKKTLQVVVQALRNRLTLEDNMQCSTITVVDTGPADTAFTIMHKLGKIPLIYIPNVDKAGAVYDYMRSSWTTTSMQLKCSVANAKLILIVF